VLYWTRGTPQDADGKVLAHAFDKALTSYDRNSGKYKAAAAKLHLLKAGFYCGWNNAHL
jgi:hypothetical protein